MEKEEFELKMIEILREEKNQRKSVSDQSPPKSEWGKEAFSTKFSCYFCGEVFKRDCNYTLHLQMQHKHEDEEVIKELTEDVEHYKLDGCEYYCVICEHKYVQHTSFMRHTRNHGITYKEYQGCFRFLTSSKKVIIGIILEFQAYFTF